MTRILIAANTQVTQGHIIPALARAGHGITRAATPEDALRLATDEPFGAVVIDVLMPGLDAYGLAQTARAMDPETRILFLTGFSITAMDIWATPASAPAPLTSRARHVRDIAPCLRDLLSQMSPPRPPRRPQGRVIHASFPQAEKRG